MPTARQRMLDLSPLPGGNSARVHFLAISAGEGFQIVEGLNLEIDAMPELEIDDSLELTLEDNEISLELVAEQELTIEG